LKIDLYDPTEKPGRIVLRLSTPAVLEQSLFMVVGVVSTILVGRIGNTAISAVGLINSVIALIMAMFIILSTGSTVIVARLIGEGDSAKAKQAVILTTIAGFVSSFVITVFIYIFSADIIQIFFAGAEPLVKQYSDIYLRITLYTLPLFLVNVIISGCLRGAGDTKTPMWISYIVNVVNILLGVVLIYGLNLGFLKIDPMGVTGAAIAVCIARGIGGLLAILAVFRSKSVITLFKLGRIIPDLLLLKRIVKIGIPASLEQFFMQGGFLILQMLVTLMGTTSLAIYQIVLNANSIISVPIWGYGTAAITLVGQTLGNRRSDLSEKYGMICIKIGLMVTFILSVIVFIFAKQIISVYTTDLSIINSGAAAVRFLCVMQPFLSVVIVLSNAMRGAGDVVFVMVSTFVCLWLVRILSVYIFGIVLKMGVSGVWIAMSMDWVSSFVVYFIRFRHGRWKQIAV